MEAERRKIRSSSTAKRTPLSNLTNTLIPDRISTKPQIPKPYNSSLKFNTKSLNSHPSKSDSSIGSSNINNVPNPSIRPIPEPLFSTPPPQPRPRTSSINLRNGDVSEPLVIYSRKQSTDKTKKSIGEDADVPYTDPSLEKTRGREKKGFSALTHTPVEKTRDKGKGIFVPFSSPSLVKTKAKGKAVAPSYHNLEENEERGAMVVPMAQSCPPQRITRNKRKQFNEAVDSLQSKLHTDPRPTKKKRLCSSQKYDVQPSLPQDFVEQQRAYFKEIDDFELLEEEVSC